VVFRKTTTTVPNNTSKALTVSCNAGERATGGGGALIGTTSTNQRLITSIPTAVAGTVPDGWSVTAFNGTGATRTLEVYVICAAP
jgi:hypothetical protein